MEPVGIVRHQTAEGLDTSDWKTYRNEKYGFGIKYPPDLIKISDFGREGLYKNFDFSGSTRVDDNELCLQSSNIQNPRSHEGEPCTLSFISEPSDGKPLFDWLLNKYSAQYFGSIQEYTKQTGGQFTSSLINNLRWYGVSTQEGPGGSSVIFATNRNFVVSVNVSNLVDVGENIFENQYVSQILSTFKFIKPGSKEDNVCIQVITPARNPQTGEIRDFPTPCDVPENWEIIK